MKSAMIARKFRGRMDRLAPGVAFLHVSKVAAKKMPSVVNRLIALTKDSNNAVALAAIRELRSWIGLDAFLAAGFKKAAEGPEEDEDGDAEKVSRRGRLAKRYANDDEAADADASA